MTKQEIEKAIKNGESVWVNGIEHKLDKYYFVAEYNNEPTLYLMTCGYEEDDWNNYPVATITNIYKTKAEAKHYLHHANITRTETLPFLTWEDFTSDIMAFNSFGFITEDGFRAELMCDKATNLIILDSGKEIKTWDLTEANFYKAYDECVRMFRRE